MPGSAPGCRAWTGRLPARRIGVVIASTTRALVIALTVALAVPDDLAFAHELERFPDIVDSVRPAIVGVGTYLATRRPPAELTGTGFVIGDGRQIATNHHVVAGSLDRKRREKYVVFIGRGRDAGLRDATITKADEVHDLAILGVTGAPLPALRLDDDATVREGEPVAFTGFPIGAVLGLYPVTHRGIVSAITPIAIPARDPRELSAAQIKTLRAPYDVLQLDAVAYPGNSGSPVYRTNDGTVVGIINRVLVKGKKEKVLSDPSAITYAIPVRYLRGLLR